MLSIYMRRVCRRQRNNHKRIMNWWLHYIQSALLQYQGPFFGNIVLMKKSTKRRGVKHPGFCRHTLLPQDRNLRWSPRLGGRYRFSLSCISVGHLMSVGVNVSVKSLCLLLTGSLSRVYTASQCQRSNGLHHPASHSGHRELSEFGQVAYRFLLESMCYKLKACSFKDMRCVSISL